MGSLNDYKIGFKSLSEGLYTYIFKVDGEFFKEFDNTEILGGDCTVEVELNRHESMLEANITIEGVAIVECDRCLDDCPVDIDYEGTLIVKFSDESAEFDGEILLLPTGETDLDLSQYIYESIVLSLPYQRVHPEGECNAEMMERFRIITSEEFDELEEDAEEVHGIESNDMAKLLALKEQMEKE